MSLKHQVVLQRTEPQIILFLADSAEIKNRLFALDVLAQLLRDIFAANSDPESHVSNSSLKPSVIFSILTRCDDISPIVRTRALIILSQNMKYVLHFLNATRNEGKFEFEHPEDVSDIDLDINGNHRYFWYNLGSYAERLNELQAVLRRRIRDVNANTRKSALLAFGNLLLVDRTCIAKENLECFLSASKDVSIDVRKKLIQCVSIIFDVHRENPAIHKYWLKCILPLIEDDEISIHTAALSTMEVQFLGNIFSPVPSNRICALNLLKMLSSDALLVYHRFFKKLFYLWKSENKLRSEMVVSLLNCIETNWEECIWFYVSYFALYCQLPITISDQCVKHLEDAQDNGNHPSFMKYILEVIALTVPSLKLEVQDSVQRIVSDSLKSFSVPVELIPKYVELLLKAHKRKESASKFERFSSEVVKKCEGHLTDFISNESSRDFSSEELLLKCFCTIKELCHLHPSNISPSVISALKIFSFFIHPTTPMSRSVKAHAFATLGKICLQDVGLVRELLTTFIYELLCSEHDIIRNNALIVLVDICKRYKYIADKCLPFTSFCFKDKHSLVRFQAALSLAIALQEGHIKWQRSLYFSFLSTLVDRTEFVREIGKQCLEKLSNGKRGIFFYHFGESILIFNNFIPPDIKLVDETMKMMEPISLPGQKRQEKRMVLYRFQLKMMSLKERLYLIKSISQLLFNLAASVYSQDAKMTYIIRDCFAILRCAEMGAIKVNLQLGEDMNEATLNVFNKTELNLRTHVIVDFLIPALIKLKNGMTDPKSDLMHDILLFLNDLLCNFEGNLKDIFSREFMLLKQLELEFGSDVESDIRKTASVKHVKEKDKQTAIMNSHPMNNHSIALQQDNTQRIINGSDKSLKEKSSARKRKLEDESVAHSDQYERNT